MLSMAVSAIIREKPDPYITTFTTDYKRLPLTMNDLDNRWESLGRSARLNNQQLLVITSLLSISIFKCAQYRFPLVNRNECLIGPNNDRSAIRKKTYTDSINNICIAKTF